MDLLEIFDPRELSRSPKGKKTQSSGYRHLFLRRMKMLKSLSVYFFPKPPQVWNGDLIREANRLSEPLNFGSFFLKTLGAAGFLFSTYKWTVSSLNARVLKSNIYVIWITSLALFALGLFIKRIANRHCVGLTKEIRNQVAAEELKKVFDQLPICKTEDELKEKLEKDPNFGAHIASNAVEEINKICFFVHPLYRPLKELIPRFDISPRITTELKDFLLDEAFKKKIILYFQDHTQYIYTDFPEDYYVDFTKEYGTGCKEKLQVALDCSIRFLHRHLPLDDHMVAPINEQLRALCVKWDHSRSEEIRMYKPNIYLEDKDTLVIRGNSCEIAEPIKIFEQLAPSFKNVKVQRGGLFFMDVYDNKWANFKAKLNDAFPGKITFIDAVIENPKIWQENIPVEKTLKDIYNDCVADFERQKRFKQNQNPVNPQPIPLHEPLPVPVPVPVPD